MIFVFFYVTKKNKRLLSYTTLTDVFCATEVERIDCKVRTESVNRAILQN
jgi:hypothetical protein